MATVDLIPAPAGDAVTFRLRRSRLWLGAALMIVSVLLLGPRDLHGVDSGVRSFAGCHHLEVIMVEPDLSILFGAAWVCYRSLLHQRLAQSGFKDIRYPDGELIRLLHYSGALTVSGIGAAQGVTRQAASKTVDSLVRRGYAVKERLPEGDGRERVVRLTDRGLALRSTAIEAADGIETELATALGPDAARQLRAALTDLIRRAGDAPPPLIAALTPLLLPASPHSSALSAVEATDATDARPVNAAPPRDR